MSYANELSYRQSAVEGASPIGLVIALYDTLWGDLRRAATAIRGGNIELRCKEVNHALLVLGQLESWIAPEGGGDLAASLTLFYRYLRARLMEASVQQSAPILEEAMGHILHVRSAWQQRDTPVPSSATEMVSVTEDATRLALSFTA